MFSVDIYIIFHNMLVFFFFFLKGGIIYILARSQKFKILQQTITSIYWIKNPNVPIWLKIFFPITNLRVRKSFDFVPKSLFPWRGDVETMSIPITPNYHMLVDLMNKKRNTKTILVLLMKLKTRFICKKCFFFFPFPVDVKDT